MAADKRRSTPMKTHILSAFIRVPRRPMNEFLSPASRLAGAVHPSAAGDRHEVPAHAQREEETGAAQQAGSPASPGIHRHGASRHFDEQHRSEERRAGGES